MAQLSRPYQVGLVAVALLAAVWLLLLQGSHSSPSTSGSASSAPPAVRTVTAPTAPSKAAGSHRSSGGASSTYHGSAPGVAGLTRAIAKANGAVATSQQNAKQLEEKSAQASSTTGSSAGSTSTAGSPSAAKAVPNTASRPAGAKATPAPARQQEHHRGSQHAVEAQLAQGKIVRDPVLGPQGRRRRRRARRRRTAPAASRGLRIAVDEASASQVASFGTITRGVQVYGTPTILIVNKSGKTRTLTGPAGRLRDPRRRSAKHGTPSLTLARVSHERHELVQTTSNTRWDAGHLPAGAFTGAAGGAACGDLVRISVALDPAPATGVSATPASTPAAAAPRSPPAAPPSRLLAAAPLLDAARIGAAEIAAELGGLSPAKRHAAELAADALHRALGAAARARAPLATVRRADARRDERRRRQRRRRAARRRARATRPSG